MMRGGGIGGFGRVIAGLLVLALLALSGAPALAAAPVAAHDCMAAGPAGDQALLPSGQPAGDHHGETLRLTCCLAALCPMLLGRPPAPPPQPRRSAALRLRPASPALRCPGIDLAPALPPPRVMA